MTKHISITKFTTMALLTLACASGCSLELGGMKDIDDLVSVNDDDEGGKPKGSGGGSGTIGGSGSEGGGSASSSAIVPESGAVYQGGDKILLSDSGVGFTIPEGLYGAGDSEYFDIGHEDWMGLVSVYGLEMSRTDLEGLLVGGLDMGGGEYWYAEASQSYEDATVVDYLVDGSTDGITHATITAIYGETGITAMLMGVGVDSTIEDVMAVSDEVAMSTTFTPMAD